jgi:hypothetical protein
MECLRERGRITSREFRKRHSNDPVYLEKWRTHSQKVKQKLFQNPEWVKKNRERKRADWAARKDQHSEQRRSLEYRLKKNTLRRERYEREPNYRFYRLLTATIQKAIKMRDATKLHQTKELIGCTPAELREHLERQFLPGMSWANRDKWHIDHIRPCASFNLVDSDEQKACFHFTNLRPLWAEQNIAKSDKLTFLL